MITKANENPLIFKCYFIRKDYGNEQAPFTSVIPFGIHFSADSTETMQTKCLAQDLNELMQPGYEPSIAVSRNLQFAITTNGHNNITQ